jgi:hypothetical protein
MLPESLLLHSQQSATCPYPEPDQSTPCPIPLLQNPFWHLYVLGLLYRMTLRTEPSHRDVRTRSAASRVDLGTRYVTVCGVSLVAGRSGRGSEIMIINAIRWGAWSAGCGGGKGGVGKQWTEKESFQQYFCNRYKILHKCHTYCCYEYHFYVLPKTYKWFGTFIIKDGRYTFLYYPQI